MKIHIASVHERKRNHSNVTFVNTNVLKKIIGPNMLHLFMRKRNFSIDICDDFSSKVNTNNCAESIHEKKEPIKCRIMT